MKHYLVDSFISVADGLFRLRSVRWGMQLWASCKVRKKHLCVITGDLIRVGEQAYRPITNQGNRYERISAKAFIELINEKM